MVNYSRTVETEETEGAESTFQTFWTLLLRLLESFSPYSVISGYLHITTDSQEKPFQWTLTQRLPVSHVIGTGPTDVGPLQEQIRESVQAQAGGEGGDQTVETPENDADRPADAQQDHQPNDAPEACAAISHPALQRGKEAVEELSVCFPARRQRTLPDPAEDFHG